MKAYAMSITNRDRTYFCSGVPHLSQLDDYLAIVVVDGKEKFFDPERATAPTDISPGSIRW